MLWQLRYERQTEPALSTSPRDAGDLCEQILHLRDAFARQKFVGLFDDDHYRGGSLAGFFICLIRRFLGTLQPAENIRNDQVIDERRVCVAEIDNGHAARLDHSSIIHRCRARPVEDVDPFETPELPKQTAPTDFVISLDCVDPLL